MQVAQSEPRPVTSGIVRALGRAGLGIKGYEEFIQTDAAVNPGNPGRALVNIDGKWSASTPRSRVQPVATWAPVSPFRSTWLATLPIIASGDATRRDDRQRSCGLCSGQSRRSARRSDRRSQWPFVSAAQLRTRVRLVRAGETIELDLLRNGQRVKASARIQEAVP